MKIEENFSTTFHQDFQIAEAFGSNAIKDTYKRAFKEWKHHFQYLTDLVMVLNHRCWMWYNKNDEYCQLYSDLFYKAQDYAIEHLKGEELQYYLEVTD